MQQCFNFHFAFLSRFIILVRCENKMFCASSTLNFVKTLEKKNCFASFLNAYLSICVPTMSMTLRTYCIILFSFSFNPHHSRSVCKRCWKLDRECHVDFCMFLTPHELNFELLIKTQKKRKMKRNAWKLSCILLFWNTVFIRSCPVVYVLYKRQYVHSDNDLVRFSSFLCYNLIIIICVVYKLLFLRPSYCREHL